MSARMSIWLPAGLLLFLIFIHFQCGGPASGCIYFVEILNCSLIVRLLIKNNFGLPADDNVGTLLEET